MIRVCFWVWNHCLHFVSESHINRLFFPLLKEHLQSPAFIEASLRRFQECSCRWRSNRRVLPVQSAKTNRFQAASIIRPTNKEGNTAVLINEGAVRLPSMKERVSHGVIRRISKICLEPSLSSSDVKRSLSTRIYYEQESRVGQGITAITTCDWQVHNLKWFNKVLIYFESV